MIRSLFNLLFIRSKIQTTFFRHFVVHLSNLLSDVFVGGWLCKEGAVAKVSKALLRERIRLKGMKWVNQPRLRQH